MNYRIDKGIIRGMMGGRLSVATNLVDNIGGFTMAGNMSVFRTVVVFDVKCVVYY